MRRTGEWTAVRKGRWKMSEISQTMHFGRNEFGIVRVAMGCLRVGVSIDMTRTDGRHY